MANSNPNTHTVVTGGAGFIGSHLCAELIRRGSRVTCLDSFETGRRANITQVLDDQGFRLIRGDVADGIDVEGPVDVVYHLAAPATPGDYLLDPVRAMRVASHGTVRALEFAHSRNARFVLVSTAEAYGSPTSEPHHEAQPSRIDPSAAYGAYYEARRFSESLTGVYRTAYGMHTSIARVFGTYGPRMRLDDGRLLSRFIRQAKAGGPLTVPGSGAQRLSVCYVDDVVTGVLSLAASSHPGPVNIGNPDEISVFSVAHDLARLAGPDTELTFVEAPAHGARTRRPDIELAGDVLGWRPRVAAADGLATTMSWFAGQGSDGAATAPNGNNRNGARNFAPEADRQLWRR